MKVAVSSCYDRNIGGTYFYNLKLLKALSSLNEASQSGQEKLEVHLIAPEEPYREDLARMGLDDHIHFHPVPLPGPVPGIARWLLGIHRRVPACFKGAVELLLERWVVRKSYQRILMALGRPDFDLVIGTAPDALPLFLDGPFHAIIHDVYFYRHFFETNRPEILKYVQGGDSLREWVTRTMARRSQRILVESYLSRSQISALYNVRMKEIQVVPTGPAEPQARARERKQEVDSNIRSRVDSMDAFVFYPGHVHILKNQERIFQALSILNEAGLRIPLLLTSPAEQIEDSVHDQLKSLGLQDQVYFLGFVNQATLEFLYNRALCLCMATYIGPTNMPIWEAMRAGCPVIASDVGDQRWQVGEEGLLFDPDNEEELAEYIRQLAQDSAFREKEGARLKDRYEIFAFHQWDAKIREALL